MRRKLHGAVPTTNLGGGGPTVVAAMPRIVPWQGVDTAGTVPEHMNESVRHDPAQRLGLGESLVVLVIGILSLVLLIGWRDRGNAPG